MFRFFGSALTNVLLVAGIAVAPASAATYLDLSATATDAKPMGSLTIVAPGWIKIRSFSFAAPGGTVTPMNGDRPASAAPAEDLTPSFGMTEGPAKIKSSGQSITVSLPPGPTARRLIGLAASGHNIPTVRMLVFRSTTSGRLVPKTVVTFARVHVEAAKRARTTGDSGSEIVTLDYDSAKVENNTAFASNDPQTKAVWHVVEVKPAPM